MTENYAKNLATDLGFFLNNTRDRFLVEEFFVHVFGREW